MVFKIIFPFKSLDWIEKKLLGPVTKYNKIWARNFIKNT